MFLPDVHVAEALYLANVNMTGAAGSKLLRIAGCHRVRRRCSC